jgi:hypothetical protein
MSPCGKRPCAIIKINNSKNQRFWGINYASMVKMFLTIAPVYFLLLKTIIADRLNRDF